MNKIFKGIFYSFSVQLVLLHLRSNLLLLSFWLLFLLLMSGTIGRRLGIQYLFLDPEYLGQVGFFSFFIVGLSLGLFFMSWNLTTYLLNAHLFPFLACLAKPFTKFSINNLLFPLAFFLIYFGFTAYFQYSYQLKNIGSIMAQFLAICAGIASTIIIYSLYFSFTNKDISSFQKQRRRPPNLVPFGIGPSPRTTELDFPSLEQKGIEVRTYLNEKLKARLVRSVAHYESKFLLAIFKQNHFNVLVLQLITMLALLLLGYLVDWPVFRIPAAASLLIFFSILIAIIGALTYWFGRWRAFIMLSLLIAINYITSFGILNHPNKAYGLLYDTEKTTAYNYEKLEQLCFSDQLEKDFIQTQDILNKRIAQMPSEKPKIVLLCASGGGLKASTWSTHVLQTANEMSQGRLFNQSVLMTGASGGMLGMAYVREVYKQKQLDSTFALSPEMVIEDVSADLLNSIAFSIVSNDLFLPWNRFKHGSQYYFKDRGYIFEQQLNENTHGLLDIPLSAYQQAEQNGEIPLLYLTPSIVNDGRQMLISAQGASFMMIPPIGLKQQNTFEVDAVDFHWLFKDQDADSLRFLSALRMNATYPYVLPLVHLPTTPSISVMDAGFRDNYGILAATRFIQVYKDWIKENTSGVVLVQITSSEKIEQIEAMGSNGVITSLITPLGVAKQTLEVQEYQHDSNLSFIYEILGEEQFELIRFIYHPRDAKKLKASVSFHITDAEKEDVLHALDSEENQNNLMRLVESLEVN